MDGVKIKKWILLTYRIPNKAIHIYAKRKEDEYRNKQLEILDEDFIVSVQPFSFIQLQFSQMKLSKKLSYINGNITYDLNSLPTIPNDTWDTMYKGGFEIGFKAGISSIPSFFVDLYAMVNYAVAEEDWSTFYYAKGLQDGLNMGKNAYEHFR